MTTEKGQGRRAVGEVLADPTAAATAIGGALARLTGFENHAGLTTIGPAARALGTVTTGVGNDGRGGEGAWAGRVVGTYLHGPVLARNPTLADALLRLATGLELDVLDDDEELALHAARVAAATGGRRRAIPLLDRVRTRRA